MTEVILVDPADEPIGVIDKLAAHRPPAPLHRAFSLFLLDQQGKVLLQRRARSKYHFAGLWANSCCGHPLPGEDVLTAAARRAGDELGVRVARLHQVGSVSYRASDPVSGLQEHELDHVVIGQINGPIDPNPAEVAEIALLSPLELTNWLLVPPPDCAPWLPLVWPVAEGQLGLHR